MREKVKPFLCGIVSFILISSTLVTPVIAAGKAGTIISDTTNDISRSVGDQYLFQITTQNKGTKVVYTVGNGKILKTFTSERPTENKDGTVTYHFGLICSDEGTTGVYMTVDGKPTKIFTVQVRDKTTFEKAVGTDATKYSKIVIQRMNVKRTISDQKEIQSVLNDIAAFTLTKKPEGTPHTSGWTYTLRFYPIDGSGAYTFVDTDGFSRDEGCTVKGPTGIYVPDQPQKLEQIFDSIIQLSK